MKEEQVRERKSFQEEGGESERLDQGSGQEGEGSDRERWEGTENRAHSLPAEQ